MLKIDFFGLWLNFGLWMFLIIAALLFVIFLKKKAEKTIMAVVLTGTILVQIWNVDALISPEVETANVTFVEGRRNGTHWIIGGESYHFRIDTDGSDIYINTDIFTLKHLFGFDLTEGEQYVIAYETKSGVLVGVRTAGGEAGAEG